MKIIFHNISCYYYCHRFFHRILDLVYINSSFQTGIKNPLDDAILALRTLDISSFQKIDEIRFDFHRKRMSVVVRKEDQAMLICKGAREEILKVCIQDREFMGAALKQYELLSADGFRVLAIATKNGDQPTFSKQDEKNLFFEGFIAFVDPQKNMRMTLYWPWLQLVWK